MPRTSSYLGQLDTLSRQLASRNNTDNRDGFKESLTGVADVVREAENAEASDLAEIAEKAGQVFDAAVGWAYSAGDYDFLPSYAHHASESPLVQDSFHRFGHGTATSFLQLMGRIGQGPIPQATRDELLPAPWTASHPPHTKSTRLSRFRDGVHPSVTDAMTRARMICEARCEVAADSFPSPIQAAIAADSSVLTIIGQGGWNNREPTQPDRHILKSPFSTQSRPSVSNEPPRAGSELDNPRRRALILSASACAITLSCARPWVSYARQPPMPTHLHPSTQVFTSAAQGRHTHAVAHPGYMYFAAGTGEAAPAFGMFAFALEDWDR
ncbi:hypothetical protein NUW54_g5870 [Trametes sanguinea]|uniref:Uncharacterized protein n=1 Tax=Trametes sanguinea TaxID=158606 RepID=A0ACC1PUV8_9APHY|nr:hypothetical protein NUW54_g5870 [Trametes sanguinea]